VDPGDAGPVIEFLRKARWRLSSILITHHHGDHVGGITELVRRFADLPVFGGAGDRGRIPGQTAFLNEGDEVRACGNSARVLEVPGHTRPHVAYFFADGADGGDLFSGDTIFGGTIGNLFEGTPDQMFGSVRKIRALPAGTRIWCAHEYTRRYLPEALSIEPDNARLRRRLESLGGSKDPTVPLSLEEECATNPFFRWDDAALCARLGTRPGIETFCRLCEIT
jgi:hydroxyacylglutathione hydrolase